MSCPLLGCGYNNNQITFNLTCYDNKSSWNINSYNLWLCRIDLINNEICGFLVNKIPGYRSKI